MLQQIIVETNIISTLYGGKDNLYDFIIWKVCLYSDWKEW